MNSLNWLFDLDGTLTDPKEGIVRCIRFAMAELGTPLKDDVDLDFCIGPPLQESLAQLIGPGQEAKVMQALEAYRTRFSEKGMFENAVYPGIIEALQGLHGKAKLFVATSKPSVYAEEIIRHFGLAGFFEGIYGSDLDGRNSRKEDLIAAILEESGLEAGKTSMIGDRSQDILGAKAHHLGSIGILWGYGSRAELESAGADHIVESPKHLLVLLAQKVSL
jgi:phosphoglycolate phosphatase